MELINRFISGFGLRVDCGLAYPVVDLELAGVVESRLGDTGAEVDLQELQHQCAHSILAESSLV